MNNTNSHEPLPIMVRATITTAQWRQLRALAALRGIDAQDLVGEAIIAYLENQDQKVSV